MQVPSYNNAWDGSPDENTKKAGHGTAVASVIAAVANNGLGTIGVCPRCSIMAVRVSTPAGSFYSDRIAAGIIWAANHGADVINVSISAAYNESSTSVDRAITYAESVKDAVVVLASGNGVGNNGKGTDDPRANSYATHNPEAIRVADAETPDNGVTYRLDPISNYGQRLADVSAFASWVPVDSIKFADERAVGATGTSIAAGVVSGIAGLVRSSYPWLTHAQVKRVIVKSCSQLGFEGVPCGGIVSAARALAVAAKVPDPVNVRVKIRGIGKVAVSGQKTCRSSCLYNLVAGTQQLHATPTSRKWRFVGWRGGTSSKNPRLSLNIEEPEVLTAVFVRRTK
jgi:subtilisin family serine protease